MRIHSIFIKILLYAVIASLIVFMMYSCAKSKEGWSHVGLGRDSVSLVKFDTVATPAETEVNLGESGYQDLELKEFPVGKLSYSIPDTMDYDREYRAVLRISKKELDSVMTSVLGIPVKKGFIIVNNVRIGSVMKTELIDVSTDKTFSIKQLSSTEQDIDERGFTEWQWNVRPNKSGNHSLRMVVNVTVDENGKVTSRDIPVFEREVYVHSRPFKTVLDFVKEYWQWIFAAILLPLVKYLWGLFQKDRGDRQKRRRAKK